ncbi:MAG: hypothetical protein IJW37_01665 [Lachnospiraceae bacterium]|nr:hypothetical protein [Lachnospiraceae bacterium]
MIILITAIAPEAEAVRTACSMRKTDHLTFSLYEAENAALRLLVTGAGKLNAAMAVTEYLTRYSYSETDVFCNLGICGGASEPSVGDGFLCAGITELSTGKSLYPELYAHPFREARLFTSDVPVTEPTVVSEGTLPALFDMEGYGVATALFRRVMPSRCFFYKVVSDGCNGQFPTPKEVTALLRLHLTPLLDFLKTKEQLLRSDFTERIDNAAAVSSLTGQLTADYPFSATMERKLEQLCSYAVHAGLSTDAFFNALPAPADGPQKKKEALAVLQRLEDALLHPPESQSSPYASVPKKRLHPFGRIYVERDLLSHPTVLRILARFPKASVLSIDHYKDVFNRGRQDLHAQETEPSLILAANRGTLMYPGAPVCQSFGEEHFMYTSCIMNCIYDCDYCYLQGMYPSGNLVVFVNLEDYFAELDALLAKHPVYLCCSYDSDLTALNGLFPHAEEFCRYAAEHPNLRLELRTKSAARPFIKKLPTAKNIVMAFTLSPQELITRYEHYTPSLKARLTTAKEAANRGFSLRLCFDPILDVPQAETLYTTLVEEVFSVLTPEEITDISLGVFRLSKDYLKQLKKAKPACAISHYPYELTDGVCHYRTERCNELLTTVRDALHRHDIPDNKIFIWAPDESKEGDSHVN